MLSTPPLVLAGRFPPAPPVVSLDPNHHPVELNAWAEFHNGCATGLQLDLGAEISRGWL